MASKLLRLGLPTTSLGRKVAVSVSLPVALALVLGVGFLWRQALSSARADAAEEAEALADLVATSFSLATPADPEPHAAAVAALRTDWKLLGAVRNVRVVDRNGVVRWARNASEQGQHAEGFAPTLLYEPRGSHLGGRFVLPVGGASCARCHQGDALRLGAVDLWLQPPRQITEVDSRYRLAMGGALFLSVVFLGATVFAMRRYVTRPVKRLTLAMDRAKSGDFLVRVPRESDDEIGHLAEDFNATLARITELKVAEIETGLEFERMQRELVLKKELEEANRHLERRLRELQLLFELTRSVNSTLELEPLLDAISEMIGRAQGYSEFSVMLLDPTRRELVHHAGYGPVPRVRGELRFKVGEGAAGDAALRQEEVYVADVEKDPRFIRLRDEKGSLLCVPMIFKEELVGVLNFRKPEIDGFGPDETRLMRSVANQAAMAIVNARLYQATVELSITDPLTGAFNRRHLFARLEMEILRAQRFGQSLGVVMIDIDHFKHYNDTCGHPAGDTVLRQAAQLFKGQLRKLDILARYGGEEFFLVLPQTGRAEAVEVAEKLRRAIERETFADAERQPGGRITISVGVASFPEDATELTGLVDAVDAALYASKRDGRNRVSAYAPGMESHPGRERGPLAQARAALVTAVEVLEAPPLPELPKLRD